VIKILACESQESPACAGKVWLADQIEVYLNRRLKFPEDHFCTAGKVIVELHGRIFQQQTDSVATFYDRSDIGAIGHGDDYIWCKSVILTGLNAEVEQRRPLGNQNQALVF